MTKTSRYIPEIITEEFYELSGRFLSDGYNIESADDIAIARLCAKHKIVKQKDFLDLKKAVPAFIK